MATVQHVYAGSGGPNGVVVAEVGSHYTDEDTGDLWFCEWSDGADSLWSMMQKRLRMAMTTDPGWPGLGGEDVALVPTGGQYKVPVTGEGVIWSNTPGVVDGSFWTWDGPAHVSVRTIYEPGDDGDAIGLYVAVTAASEQTAP